MKSISSAFLSALIAARDTGVAPRFFVWFEGKNRASGSLETLGLWSGDYDVTVNVTSGVTGQPVARPYLGAGALLAISPIRQVSDLTIQTVTVDLSQIAPAAQEIVRGYDVRLGKIEIHEITLDPSSRQPVGTPELVFMGEIDGAPITTPAAGGEGSIKIHAASDAISMLTRKNYQKSSYEAQKRRGGDEWGKYGAVVANWTIPWGQKA
ncbi:hypothetical protein [Tianweitania sediminis]|uniref:Uncharacterized protein n=1 Tax=Tianweitania sediminis TaxID=1502156 RepID=A0A8J7UHP9_9HYPH|nr:hypothetical protein [Tianweitania sediminis]MBP0439429.1 hypothetical protein [Tianweitania sediminis]